MKSQEKMLMRAAAVCLFLIAAGMLFFSALLNAQSVPQLINYQGRLTDDTGMPIDGSREMRFRILDADTITASVLWSETHTSVQVDQGIYHVLLGSVNALPPSAISQADIFLEVRVAGEILRPRSQITSVPFAHKAASLPDGAITSAMIEDGTITGSDINTQTITSTNIANETITSTQIQDSSITGADIGTDELGETHIQDIYVLNTGDTVTGNLQVNGSIGLGTNPNNSYSLFNNSVAPPTYGAYLYGSTGGVRGMYSGAPTSNYGFMGSSSYGVYARAGTSTDVSGRYGGRFHSYSTSSSYGVYSGAYGYGSSETYGFYGYGTNNSTGAAYGGYFFSTSSAPSGSSGSVGVSGNATNNSNGNATGGFFSSAANGTGYHFGVRALAWGASSNDSRGVDGSGSNTSSGDAYGGYFTTASSGTGIHYGIYASADDYAGWFQDGSVHVGDAGVQDYATSDGDLYVEDVLEVDGNGYVGLDLEVTGGNIGLGTAWNSSYGILNDSGSAPAYGARLYGSSEGIRGAWSSDPNQHYAYLGSQDDGVYARSGASDESATRIGGRFYSYSQGNSFGTWSAAYGYGSNTAYGIRTQAQNESSGNAYGGYFIVFNFGTGIHYGVYASADDYAGWFEDGRVHVGDGGTQDYVDGDGDLYVEDELEADGNAYIGADLTVSGGNIGIGTTPNSSYGIYHESTTAPTYGANLYGSSEGIRGAWSSDPNDHYAYLGSQMYGIRAVSGASDETGGRYGGSFLAKTQDYAYGIDCTGYGYGSSDAYGIWGNGRNESTGNAYGGYFRTDSAGSGTHYGIYAESDDYGVYGAWSSNPNLHYAYLGSGTYGVYTQAGHSSLTGDKYGGKFNAFSQDTTYGVYGNAGGYGTGHSYGVYGNADGYGTGNSYGVYGIAYVDSTGNSYGIYGYATNAGSGSAYGVYTAYGSKLWVNPDPEDPTKSIAYVTIEAGENATYYAGRSRLSDGKAVVELPEHFRKVTSPDHPVIVQVTPRSIESLGLAVTKSTNSEIVVEELYGGKGDYEFDYTVKGIRLGYEDYDPIIDNVDYVPFQGNHEGLDESEGTTQEWYDMHSEGLKKIFKKNGTLKEDGSVNEELFKGKGWKVVKERRDK